MDQPHFALSNIPEMQDLDKRGSDSDDVLRVSLKANCAVVRILDKKSIYAYDVEFFPKVDSLKARQRFMTRLETMLGPLYLFNGKRLFLPSELMNTENGSLTVELSEGIDPVRPLRLTFVPVVNNSKRQKLVVQDFFNALMERLLVVLGRTHINDGICGDVVELPDHGVLIEPGMRLTIRESDGGLMLLLETFHFMWRMESALQKLTSFQNRSRSPGVSYRTTFLAKYIGAFLFATHSGKFYKLDDVAWDMNPASTYNYNGREITIADYFEFEYGVKIVDMTQPLFICRTSEKKAKDASEPCVVMNGPPSYLLVPELCHFSGIKEESRRNDGLALDITQSRRLTPIQRVHVLNLYLQKIRDNSSSSAVLKAWGVHIDNKLVELKGRVIPGPVLKFNSKKVLDFRNVTKALENQLNFMKQKTDCYLPVNLKNWIIVCAEMDLESAEKVHTAYVALAPSIGIQVGVGKIVPVKPRGTTNSVNEFLKAIRDATIVGETQLVLVILPKGLNKSLYNAVKQLCLLDLGVPTQAIRINSVSDVGFNGIIAKLALQINCKLGGALWALSNPTNEAIMYVGIDTYHDRRKMDKSVFALVSSLNSECTKYYTRTCSNKPGQETGNEIIPMFTRALREYYEVSKQYPTKIIVFRDGVSNGYLKLVKHFELEQFRWSVQNLVPVPEIIFMVYQKRTADWIFLNDCNIRNPLPGTVLDHTLTRTKYRDFLITCQLMRGNGCLQPSRCIVLAEDGYKNESGSNDYAQQLTFASSFMYYNWPGSIKSPAVCQYAHKAASLVGRVLKREPKPPLLKQLYYL